MAIFVTGTDATRIIRAYRTGKGPLITQVKKALDVPSPIEDLSNTGVREALLATLGHSPVEPLNIRVPPCEKRFKRKGVNCRVTSGPLPSELVWQTGSLTLRSPDSDQMFNINMLLDSPLLDLLMLADELDRNAKAGSVQRRQADMLVIDRICEYCGTYSLDPFEPSESEATYQLAPVLTIKEIERHLLHGEMRTHRGGIRRIRVATRYGFEQSASPSETLAAIALGAMPRLGGFHLPGIHLNEPLAPRELQREDVLHQQLTPDFYLPKARFAIEIQGAVHETASSKLEDARREHDYKVLGITALFVKADEYCTPSGMSGIALEAAAAIDRANGNDNQVNRIRRLMKSDEFVYVQRLLFDTLLNHRC